MLTTLLSLSPSVDPFSKKDWYDVKAPAMFNIRNIGKTLVSRTQGTSKSAFQMPINGATHGSVVMATSMKTNMQQNNCRQSHMVQWNYSTVWELGVD